MAGKHYFPIWNCALAVYAKVQGTPYTSQHKLTNLKKASDVVNLTAQSFCHQNNVVRPPATHQH